MINSKNFFYEQNGNRIIFSGNLVPDNLYIVLSHFFNEIHNDVIERGVDMVILDITNISFLPSTGIKALSDWINKIGYTNSDTRYMLKLVYSYEKLWQESIVSTLKFIAPEIVCY